MREKIKHDLLGDWYRQTVEHKMSFKEFQRKKKNIDVYIDEQIKRIKL